MFGKHIWTGKEREILYVSWSWIIKNFHATKSLINNSIISWLWWQMDLTLADEGWGIKIVFSRLIWSMGWWLTSFLGKLVETKWQRWQNTISVIVKLQHRQSDGKCPHPPGTHIFILHLSLVACVYHILCLTAPLISLLLISFFLWVFRIGIIYKNPQTKNTPYSWKDSN